MKESDKKGYSTDADRINIKNYDIDKPKPKPKPAPVPAKPAPSEISKAQANLTDLTTRLGKQSQPSKPVQSAKPAQPSKPAQPVKLDNVSTGGSDSDETYEKSKYKSGGVVKSSASSRGDGCAQRGKTKGKWV